MALMTKPKREKKKKKPFPLQSPIFCNLASTFSDLKNKAEQSNKLAFTGVAIWPGEREHSALEVHPKKEKR